MDPRLEAAITDLLPTSTKLAWDFFSRAPHALDLSELKATCMEALVISGAKWEDYCERNQFDPWDADGSKPESHFAGYAIKRMRGSLLDHARHQDHVTRSTRGKIKMLQAAENDGARTLEAQAAAAGLSVKTAREARAAELRRPESLDWHDGSSEDARAAIADDSAEADVEGQAVVNETLAVVVAAFDSLPAIQQVLVAKVFHREEDITDAAGLVYLEVPEARRQLEAAVCEIHRQMFMAVQGEGTAPRRPARQTGISVRSADSCSAAETAVPPDAKICCGCRALLPADMFSWASKAKGRRMHLCQSCDRVRQRRYWSGAARMAASVQSG